MIRPYGRNDLGLADKGFEDFYNMIDNFFNDEFTPQRAINSASFKVDIAEDDKGYTVEAELPGFDKEDISISLEEGKLTLVAEKKEETDKSDKSKNYIHKERKMSHMQRTMFFKNIDEDGLTARLENGVLEIKVPKKEIQSKTKNIAIE
ncbi:Hsp20/alpha crystallin family protein [Peptoniphilus catoniae]|uniref:Hsp20/alpha crystallin family protein n=1 Tax=Peptoniphilus catoniae TaxID=1660341 RepID=UPI001FEB7D40|nr:Hsp20/alpha crystallin family protein [Peptoniphilus catoniae]